MIVMATMLGRQDGGLVSGLASFMEENFKCENLKRFSKKKINNEINERPYLHVQLPLVQ